MTSNYDIFISYKRKSLPTANNLYYRLTTRGYSTFFDLEEMGRDNFNTQLLNYIENAKDVFVILEEGSLDGCKHENWEEMDWFCREIAYAIEKNKNIIPILLNGYKMPHEDFFPGKLRELSLKNAPEFNFSFFEAYLDKLIEKEYLLSKPNLQEKATSIFKFYSNENCQVFKEGYLVCSLEGMSDEPFYLPVPRKGDYRFKIVNSASNAVQIIDVGIDAVEEKNVDITWNQCDNKKDIVHNSENEIIPFDTMDVNNVKLVFSIIIVLIVSLIIEGLIFAFVFDWSHRCTIWRTRLTASSFGLINRTTLLIPSQISFISSLIFYVSSKIKTKKLWLNNLVKTVFYIMLSIVFLRSSTWFSRSFIYEICFSALMTCLFYMTWSVLLKHTSKSARSIPF